MLRWRTIRSLVQSKPLIAVSVVFVGTPIIAIVLSWFRTEWGIGGLSPWLKIAYFASLMYLLSLILYALGCPEIIQRYGSVFDRISAERDAYLRSNPDKRLEITISQLDNGDPIRENLVDLSKERDKAIGDERSDFDFKISKIVQPRWEDTVQRYLVRTYEQADQSRSCMRIFAQIAWLVGTVAASVVVAHRIFVVFSS